MVLVCTAVLAAGCGSSESVSSKPAAAILTASRAAARQASAVHVLSEVFRLGSDPKARTKPTPTSTVELQLNGDGAGRARLQLLGRESQAIRVGNTLYLNGGQRFKRRLENLTGHYIAAGTWVKTPLRASELAGFAALTEPSGELALLLRNPTLSLTKGPLTTIDGLEAIELKTTGKLYTGAIYIAATGIPYPLMIEKHGQETSTTTFTNWNKPTQLTPPTAAVPAASLAKGAGVG